MNEMVERIAVALEPKCRAFGKGNMPMMIAREFAVAALEAMRDPTPPGRIDPTDPNLEGRN